jgi:hypothetical protein
MPCKISNSATTTGGEAVFVMYPDTWNQDGNYCESKMEHGQALDEWLRSDPQYL